jgi:hypothetical protein
VKRYRLEYTIPAALAVAVTLMLIWKVPRLSEEYYMKLLDNQMAKPLDYVYFDDLNGDGISEKFSIYYNMAGNLAVSISDLRTGGTINQFNLPGELPELGATLDLHDIDANGIKDIFICTEKNDSLFLSIIDDLYGHPTFTRLYFLDRIRQNNENGDYLFTPGGISDLTGDGSPEYIFAINGGHSLQPRRVYAIDYKENRVIRSPVSGAAIVSLDLFDLNGNGKDEILLNTVAPENFKYPFPYRDSVSWLMVLDDSLQFYRPPIPMHPAASSLSLEPFIYEGKRYLMAFHRFRGKNGDFSSTLTVFDDQVQQVNKKYFKGIRKGNLQLWRIPGRSGLKDIKVFKDNRIYTLDFDLEYADSIVNEIPFGYGNECMLDIDGDGEKEYIFLDYERLCVFRADLRQSSEIDVRWNERAPRILTSEIRQGDHYPVLFIQIGTEQYSVWYGKNGWFRFRVLVYPALFIILFGFFFSLGLIQARIISRKYEREQFISRLQLQAIRNQLDPHFTYNALNAVGSLIYKGEKELAYRYLKGLTDLLRMVSADASTVTWKLSDELEFVEKYLEIEKLRFKEKFKFRIEIREKTMKEYQVPRMSILTFVENAMKHGLRHKDDNWLLDITVASLENGIKIGIRDNGIGRVAAVKYRDGSNGQGTEMMKQYFRQFSETTGKCARFKVTDLFENGLKASGTLVEIKITG